MATWPACSIASWVITIRIRRIHGNLSGDIPYSRSFTVYGVKQKTDYVHIQFYPNPNYILRTLRCVHPVLSNLMFCALSGENIESYPTLFAYLTYIQRISNLRWHVYQTLCDVYPYIQFYLTLCDVHSLSALEGRHSPKPLSWARCAGRPGGTPPSSHSHATGAQACQACQPRWTRERLPLDEFGSMHVWVKDSLRVHTPACFKAMVCTQSLWQRKHDKTWHKEASVKLWGPWLCVLVHASACWCVLVHARAQQYSATAIHLMPT